MSQQTDLKTLRAAGNMLKTLNEKHEHMRTEVKAIKDPKGLLETQVNLWNGQFSGWSSQHLQHCRGAEQ